jgi:transcriptional regulator with XRE-family HTH domain
LSRSCTTVCIPEVAKLIYELLPELREARGITAAELARITVRQGGTEVPQKSIEALESKARAGQVPKAHTLQALADALGVKPDVFYEWPIAVAQAQRATRSLGEIAQEGARLRGGTTRTPPREGQRKPGSGQAA